jgi:hypothetical protein
MAANVPTFVVGSLAARRAWRTYRPKPRDSASPSFDGYALSSYLFDDIVTGAEAQKKPPAR